MGSLSIVLVWFTMESFHKHWVGQTKQGHRGAKACWWLSLQSSLSPRSCRKEAAWPGRMLSWAVPLGPFYSHSGTDSVNCWQSWPSAMLWPGHDQNGVLQKQGIEGRGKACNLDSLHGRKWHSSQPCLHTVSYYINTANWLWLIQWLEMH